MTKIRESSYSTGGPCHCGKPGHYAVPRQASSGWDYFCFEHRQQAYDLMYARHTIRTDRGGLSEH